MFAIMLCNLFWHLYVTFMYVICNYNQMLLRFCYFTLRFQVSLYLVIMCCTCYISSLMYFKLLCSFCQFLFYKLINYRLINYIAFSRQYSCMSLMHFYKTLWCIYIIIYNYIISGQLVLIATSKACLRIATSKATLSLLAQSWSAIFAQMTMHCFATKRLKMLGFNLTLLSGTVILRS